MIENPHMLTKVRSTLLRHSCSGMPCTLRISSFRGRPCASQSTVVGCHLPVFGKGVSTKVSDLFMAAGCANCHELLDMVDRGAHELRKDPEFWRQIHRAHCETLARWIMCEALPAPTDAELI